MDLSRFLENKFIMERLQCRGDPAVLFFPRQFSLHRIDRWIFKSYGLKESCNLSELVPLDAEVPQLLKRAGDSVNPNVPVALFRSLSHFFAKSLVCPFSVYFCSKYHGCRFTAVIPGVPILFTILLIPRSGIA